MTQRTSTILALAALVSLESCSWTTLFIITNTTVVPIRVAYLAQPLRTEPAVAPNATIESNARLWRPIQVPLAEGDSGVVEFVLGPDTAVLVAEIGTYTGYSDAVADWFTIKRLEVESPHGRRVVEGREVLGSFVERNKRLYVLEVH